MRTITLALTTYQRYEFLIDSFNQVLDDPRISEIVIVDDASDKLLFDKIKLFCDPYPKIKLYQNPENMDCYRNKKIAVDHSSNDWLILLDSDNVIDKKYLDVLFSIPEWKEDTAYQPTFAFPNFDFRIYGGQVVTKQNVKIFMGPPMFETSLNAMNYFVNRQAYIDAWDGNVNPHTADSIYQNYNFLRIGNKIQYCVGLEYFHRVHQNSHYINNNHKTGNFYQIIIDRIKAMG